MDILLTDIPRLQAKYDFILKKYDINIMANYELLEKMEEHVEEIGEDLPVVFINDSVFYGSDQIHAKLESTLKKGVKQRIIESDTIRIATDSSKITTNIIHVYYFVQPGCRACQRTDALLKLMLKRFPNVIIHNMDISTDSCKIFFEQLAIQNNMPEHERLIAPAIIIGHDYLIKEKITLKNLDDLLLQYQNGSSFFEVSDFTGARKSIRQRFSRFSIVGILVAGLLDGVNPCAFATLIFFVSYLLFVGKRRKDIVLMATFFILAVFIVYFVIGLGAYNLLRLVTHVDLIAKIVFILFGAAALILGALNLRDYFLARRAEYEKMILQLPLGLKQRIHQSIRTKSAWPSIVFGSLVTGFIISILEFGCTGQVYLPTITFIVSQSGYSLKPIIALLAYNIMFVMPLIIIALLAIMFATDKVARLLKKRIALVKLLTAVLFFVLGALLLITA